MSSTESYPNQLPTSQQWIGSKNSLGTCTGRRSLCTLGPQNQKSKAASVGGLFHSSILGMDILKYWKIYFDYPEKVIEFRVQMSDDERPLHSIPSLAAK